MFGWNGVYVFILHHGLDAAGCPGCHGAQWLLTAAGKLLAYGGMVELM